MWDTIYGHYHGYNDFKTTLHHVVMFSIFFVSYVTEKNGQEVMWALIWSEITSIILNFNRVLVWNEASESLVFRMDMLLLISFLSVRMVVLSQIMVSFHLEHQMGFLLKLLPSFIFYFSMDWAWSMVNKMTKLIHMVSFHV